MLAASLSNSLQPLTTRLAMCLPAAVLQQREVVPATAGGGGNASHRLDVLFRQLHAADTASGSSVRRASTSSSGSGGSSSASSSSSGASGAARDQSDQENTGAETLQQLHPAFTQFINSGYIQSQKQLRERLMTIEWDETVRAWALSKGVAEFSRFVAEKGEELGMSVSWEEMQALYADPEPGNLSALAGQPRARLLAQAIITQELVKQQCEVYKATSDTAQKLANVIESSHRTGASTLLGLVRKLLPLPGFLK